MGVLHDYLLRTLSCANNIILSDAVALDWSSVHPRAVWIIGQGHHCHTPAAAESYWKKKRFMSILVILNQGAIHTTGSLVALNFSIMQKENVDLGVKGVLQKQIGYLGKLSKE